MKLWIVGALCGGLLCVAPAADAADATTTRHRNHDNWNWQRENWDWSDQEPTDQGSWQDDGSNKWDGAGGGWTGDNSTQDWSPRQEQLVRIRRLAVDTPALSPNGDNINDSAMITFWLSSTQPVGLRVVNDQGTTVRVLGIVRQRGQSAVEWDGKNDVGGVVPDGGYSIEISRGEDATGGTAVLKVGVDVDSTAPKLTVRRPSLAALRQAAIREARRIELARRLKSRGHGRRKHSKHRGWNRHNVNQDEWNRWWNANYVPLTFATTESGNVGITATVAGKSTKVLTWSNAGREKVKVLLPTYKAGAKLKITITASDEAGNNRRTTMSMKLPTPPVRKQDTNDDNSNNGGNAPANPGTPEPPPSGGNPFPAWYQPVLLKATYEAGVPQSWATSKALYNVVSHESSFRPTAQNPTSTAYGLFQFLNTTWATVGCHKTSDAYKQTVCGLRYVSRRYHSPTKAWAFWQAHHWY
jgi:hypothetical protein